ncbi:hypothetical protein JKP88DRAFT_256268, partial [Tribonema minus]
MLVVVDANTSEATITLPRPITAADGYSLRMCVQNLTLANTQLPINDYCNEITVNGVTGVVDSGNYSAANLALLLDGVFSGINVSYDEISGKMTLAASTPFTIGGSMLDVLDVTAGFGAHAYDTGNRVINTAQGVLASARRGDVNGIQRGGQSAVTDLAGLHNQYQNLRSQLQYPQVRAIAASAISSRYANQPVSGTSFAGNSTCSIDIQGSAQWACHLEPAASMLRFRVNCAITGGTTPTWSTTPFNCISAISLYSSAGSTCVENTQNHNALHAVLRDTCSNRAKAMSADTITQGIDANRPRTSVCNAAAVTYRDFAVPVCSIVSSLSAGDRYLPLNALSSPLRLDITWADPSQALAFTGGGTFTYAITNVLLDTMTITLADSVEAQLKSLTNGV